MTIDQPIENCLRSRDLLPPEFRYQSEHQHARQVSRNILLMCCQVLRVSIDNTDSGTMIVTVGSSSLSMSMVIASFRLVCVMKCDINMSISEKKIKSCHFTLSDIYQRF